MNDIEARLLAEAVRIHEEGAGSLPDPAADAVGRRAGGSLEHRILVRARELGRPLGMVTALDHVRGALRFVVATVQILAGLAGATAGQAVMGPGGGNVVNFFVVLFAALGPETAALLYWLVLVSLRSTRAAGLVGRAAASLGGRLVLLTHSDATHLAALRAVGGVMAGGPYGRWTLGAITHAAWLAFLASLLAMVVFLLSTRSYVFVWETTILSADTYVPLTRFLSSLPTLIGFAAPGPDEIRASQWIGSGAKAADIRDAWAGLLVGCIVVYGIVPRAALLIACLLLRTRAGRRFRLDTTRPGYAKLAGRLMPMAEGLGFSDSGAGPEPQRPHSRHNALIERIPGDPYGPVAFLGLEIDLPASGWPPTEGGAPLDLGRAQGREDIKQALAVLRSSAPRPRLVVLVCALTTTPDRGLLARIDTITAASAIPLALLLTGGQRLRERASTESAMSRIHDWHALAARAGIDADRVAEVDLDNLTEMSRAKLGALAGRPTPRKSEGDRLERAFALVRRETASWTAPPDLALQSELHRTIAQLYRGESGMQRLFDPRRLTEGDLVSSLRSGSDRLIGMLPKRLALDPGWLTAGAVAGALGCIAVAAAVSPAAVAGLPLWGVLGAAVASALRGALGAHGAPQENRPDLSGAVKAAALLALVLESQGRPEAEITRLIESSIGDDDPLLQSESDAAEWLDRVCRRYREAERSTAGGR